MGSLDICGSLDIVGIRNQVRQTCLLCSVHTPDIHAGVLDARVWRISAWRNGLQERRLGSSKWRKLLILRAPDLWLTSWSCPVHYYGSCLVGIRGRDSRSSLPVEDTVSVSVV